MPGGVSKGGSGPRLSVGDSRSSSCSLSSAGRLYSTLSVCSCYAYLRSLNIGKVDREPDGFDYIEEGGGAGAGESYQGARAVDREVAASSERVGPRVRKGGP